MTVKSKKLKAPAPKPPAPDQSDEIERLKAEVAKLRGLLKFHTGKDFS